MARRSIYIEGMPHKNPIPNACVIGKQLDTGVIIGFDPSAGKLAEGLEAQCALIFQHIRSIMDAAGGSTNNILKLNVWLKDPDNREALNKHWVEMFPDHDTRPARQAMPGKLEGPNHIQCQFTAILD